VPIKTIVVKVNIVYKEQFCHWDCPYMEDQDGWCHLFNSDIYWLEEDDRIEECYNHKRCEKCMEAKIII